MTILQGILSAIKNANKERKREAEQSAISARNEILERVATAK